jgi:hypothetical protein
MVPFALRKGTKVQEPCRDDGLRRNSAPAHDVNQSPSTSRSDSCCIPIVSMSYFSHHPLTEIGPLWDRDNNMNEPLRMHASDFDRI